MTTYKFTDSSHLVAHVIDADGVSRSSCMVASIPAGTVVAEADPLPPDMLTCNAAQIRLALNQLGLRAAAEAAVAAGPADLQDLWQYSPRFVESDARIAAMAAAVGVDAAGLHDLFALAVTL